MFSIVHSFLKTLGAILGLLLNIYLAKGKKNICWAVRHEEPAVIGSQPLPQPEPFFDSQLRVTPGRCSVLVR